jgi:hypothetical protein
MVVRVAIARGPFLRRARLKNSGTLQVFSSLLTPISVACVLMGAWKVGDDMEWAEPFAITQGLFSHFQVWFALGSGVQALSWRLARHGRELEEAQPAGLVAPVDEPQKQRAASAG